MRRESKDYLLEIMEQIRWRYLEGASQLQDDSQSWDILTAFDEANVVGREVGSFGEGFLAQAAFLSQSTNDLAELLPFLAPACTSRHG